MCYSIEYTARGMLYIEFVTFDLREMLKQVPSKMECQLLYIVTIMSDGCYIHRIRMNRMIVHHAVQLGLKCTNEFTSQKAVGFKPIIPVLFIWYLYVYIYMSTLWLLK